MLERGGKGRWREWVGGMESKSAGEREHTYTRERGVHTRLQPLTFAARLRNF